MTILRITRVSLAACKDDYVDCVVYRRNDRRTLKCSTPRAVWIGPKELEYKVKNKGPSCRETVLSYDGRMESLAGNLLIAVPDLEDGNFFRSVVLMLHHDQFGASGVVLNRATDVTVREAWDNGVESYEEFSGTVREDVKINVGGPVDGPLIVLHEDESLSEEAVLPGVFMSVNRMQVDQIVRLPESRFRVFTGYSGWAPEQLEAEIDAGGWMVIKANSEHVFSDDPELWSRVCETFSASVVDLPTLTGADPNLN